MSLERLVEKRSFINEKLKEFFESRKRDYESEAEELLYNVVYDYTMRGGKRIRPAVMLIIYEDAKGFVDDTILAPALSIELMQNASIMQDDVIDEDVMRRGGPSGHVMAAEYYMGKNGIKDRILAYTKAEKWMSKEGLIDLFIEYKNLAKFGRAFGILGGDLLLSWAFEVVIEAKMDESKKVYALQKINELFENLIKGEAEDVGMNINPATVEEYLKMVDEKTGALFIYPVEIAAKLADYGNETVKLLADWAKYAFRAFQIRDDILGLFGDVSKTGKPIGSDLKEGKKTPLVIYTLELADDEQKVEFEKVLGNRLAGKEEIFKAREIVKECGALEKTEKLAEEMIAKALDSLERAKINEKTKVFLRDLTNFLVRRAK